MSPTIVTLTNANGDQVDFAVEFDPLHRGLVPAMQRAAKNGKKRATAANGAVTIRVVAERARSA